MEKTIFIYNNITKPRFFNKIIINKDTVTKKSKDIEKIKREYTYYNLLPESIKKWMVEPYNYCETEDEASYTMKRYFVPDLAIRWTHNSIDKEDFRIILDKLFYFIQTRPSKNVSQNEYSSVAEELYINKLEKRVKKLKSHNKYPIIDSYIKNGTDYNDIDEIINKYKELYSQLKDDEKEYVSVIGHGDLCFSNILYDEDDSLIRLIDPKGALEEKELWTNPYYDIAKLSHSICGLYDFFNCGKYEISLNENLQFDLNIGFDNIEYEDIFKEYLAKYGYDYKKIRIYEASLFLSMLPLHMDYPKKVFGFLLNGISIMNDV